MDYENYITHKISFGVLAFFTLCAGLLTSSSGQTSLGRPSAADISNAFSGREVIARREANSVSSRIEIAPSNVTEFAPTNDMFSSGEVITGTGSAIGGTNFGAGIETGEPASCGDCKTVWYRWTAPADLSMTFETYGGSLNDTVLDVYMGKAVNSLEMLVKNDNVTAGLNLHSRVTFAATAGMTYHLRVYGGDGAAGTFNLRWEINGAESWKQFNFDGAAGSTMSDYAVFRLQAGVWWIYQSLTGEVVTQKWGVVTDYLVPGDYDGDGSADIAVWRPAIEPRPTDPPPGFWVLRSSDSTFFMQVWGIPTDYPVQGDFDGDDRADITLFRKSTGTFWTIRSSDWAAIPVQWGQSGDFTVPADYDGDGRTDYAIQRGVAGNGVFWILRSSDRGVMTIPFGLAIDLVIPGDYDHDGKADLCVHRYTNDTFYWMRSSDGQVGSVQWGIWGDQLVAGDYTGNPGSDITIWRPSEGNFYSYDPINSAITIFHWGQNGDSPVGRSSVH
jgi:hypothetical protein